MQKNNIRALTWLKAIGAILLIVSVFGLAFQLFRIPDTDIGSGNGSGSTDVVPDTDETPEETPEDLTDEIYWLPPHVF